MSYAFLEPLEKRQQKKLELEADVQRLASRRDELRRALKDHKNFDPANCAAEIAEAQRQFERVGSELSEAKTAYADVSAEHEQIYAKTVSFLKIVTYFSAEQKQLRATLRECAGRLKSAKETMERLEAESAALEDAIKGKASRLEAFNNFDVSATEAEIRKTAQLVDAAASSLTQLNQEIDRMIKKVGRLVDEYERICGEASTFRTTISEAEQLERDLTYASNSYERAKTHQACERRFGDGSPKKVKGDASRKLRAREGDKSKLERRIRDELSKCMLVVDHIIIDGSNACYERSNFIGLRAVKALVKHLSPQYAVSIVFDSGIRGLLGANDAEISRILGRSAAIHVSPTKTSADQYLLQLAENQKTSYVLSNDRFAEYFDFEVVSAGRLLRFMITDDRVMVHNLDIDIPIESADW